MYHHPSFHHHLWVSVLSCYIRGYINYRGRHLSAGITVCNIIILHRGFIVVRAFSDVLNTSHHHRWCDCSLWKTRRQWNCKARSDIGFVRLWTIYEILEFGDVVIVVQASHVPADAAVTDVLSDHMLVTGSINLALPTPVYVKSSRQCWRNLKFVDFINLLQATKLCTSCDKNAGADILTDRLSEVILVYCMRLHLSRKWPCVSVIANLHSFCQKDSLTAQKSLQN